LFESDLGGEKPSQNRMVFGLT